MAAMDVLIVAIVVLVGLAFGQGDGCNCQMRHPQEHFCTADFVVLAGIRNAEIIYEGSMPIERQYTVNIKKVFKSVPEYEDANTTVIYTPGSSVACAIEQLDTDVNYLLTGKIIDGKLQISICDWIKPYRSLTQAQKNGVRSKYALGCRCEFAYCRENVDCGRQYNNATCEWDVGSMFDCYNNDGICYYDGMNCVWKETRKFRTCEEKVMFGGLGEFDVGL